MTPGSRAIEAAILAGGTSRRMGKDKPWIRLQGSAGPPLVETLVELLELRYHPLRILVGESPVAPYAALGVAVQPDLRPRCGPLGGIHAALATAERDVVLVVACDLPFLTRDFLDGLSGLLAGYDAVVPRPLGIPVPVCAFYSTRCLPALEAQLDRGELMAAAFLEHIAVRWVRDRELSELDPRGTALFNLNTPRDVERAREIVARGG